MQSASRSEEGIVTIVLRSLVVGFVYALASALAAFVLGPLSRLQPTPENFLVWLISGTLLCLALSPFVLHSRWSRWKTVLAVWALLACVRALGLGIEGSLFKPTQAGLAIVGAAVNLLVGFLVAWITVRLLWRSTEEPTAAPHAGWSWWGWTWRVLLVGLAYFIFYIVFGAANALLYTRSFYENNAQYGLALPPPGVIFLAEIIRGPLFGLGALFIVRATTMSRKSTGIWLGLLLFLVGGMGPYLETTFRTMPLGFNLATSMELFLQNFSTGLVAARLLR